MIARSNIFLIGNGFDLAHGLETSYKDFIKNICNKLKLDQNCLPELIRPRYGLEFNNEGIIDPKCFENTYHDKCAGNIVFMKIIEEMHQNNNWCDIEQLYYNILRNSPSNYIKILNNDFEQIKKKLEEYISYKYKQKQVELIDSFIVLFQSFHLEYKLLINFNYTSLPELYLDKETAMIFNIHGQINEESNPIIFGYAPNSKTIDELLSKNEDEYVRNIKSTSYSRNNNVTLLEKFLSEHTYSQYNVFILGHSCGISDEYILQKILGNKGVANIIPVYFKDMVHYKEQFNNIARIIGGEETRNKIIPFDICPEMIQKDSTIELITKNKKRIMALCEDISWKE